MACRIAEAPSVSGDGNWVVYVSEAGDLVSGQTGEMARNVYLWERASGVNRLVSHRAGSPVASPREGSFEPTLSRDGRYVAFVSDAPDLMPGQVDEEMGGFDVFLYDRETAAITLVSHLADLENTATNSSDSVTISADGTVVSFVNQENGLVPEDANGELDVFWFEGCGPPRLRAVRSAGQGPALGHCEQGTEVDAGGSLQRGRRRPRESGGRSGIDRNQAGRKPSSAPAHASGSSSIG